MLAPQLSLLATNLKARAEEISAKADTFQDADSQRKMREVAASYEDLAHRVEKFGGWNPT
jgi:hypothetical protein